MAVTREDIDSGLSAPAVAERVKAGRTNLAPRSAGPPVSRILRRNLLSPVNLLLGSAVVAVFAVGEGLDAIFALPLVFNLGIGITLELMAKRRLDRLTLLTTPKVHVRREGQVVEVGVADVVQDELCLLAPGDQVVADGPVLSSRGLEVDESALTGESDPVTKDAGDPVSSGSYVVAGEGSYRAERVGKESDAARLTAQAQAGKERPSPLQREIVDLLGRLGIVAIGVMAVYLFLQLSRHLGLKETVRNTVTASVSLIPEGLLLLVSARLALGAIRLAKRGLVVSRLDAVESLARVDVLCLDKTGTITENRLRVVALEPAEGTQLHAVEAALGRMAASMTGGNRTLGAIAEAYPAESERPVYEVSFSSARRWSGLVLEGAAGTEAYVIGAPESFSGLDRLRESAHVHTSQGRRVVLVGRVEPASLIDGDAAASAPPVTPLGLVILDDEVRAGAVESLRYFAEEGVALKLISGDHPETVRGVAARAGLRTSQWITGADLDQLDDIDQAAQDNQVFGRITPQQKQGLVEAMRRRDHHVAMIGDGVNDVLALRSADLGIALQGGTAAAQAVSGLVLLDGAFPALPETVKEGRRIVHSIITVARLFLLKTFYSGMITVGVTLIAVIGNRHPNYPFVPRQLSMMSTYSIGIPAFWLTLASRRPDRPPSSIMSEVLRLSIPAAVVAAATALFTFYLELDVAHAPLHSARSATALAVCVVAMTYIPCAEIALPPGRQRRIRLAVFLAGAYSLSFPLIFAWPLARRVYDVVPLTSEQAAMALGLGGLGAAALLALTFALRRRYQKV